MKLKKSIRAGCALGLGLLGSGFLLELAARASNGMLLSFTSTRAIAVIENPRMEPDPLLGWTPKRGLHELPGWTAHVDVRGLRVSPPADSSSERPILAIGDSFTFCDEVDDDVTWPAQLQRLSGTPVVNGGVSGYGLDQAVLRAEQLIAELEPAVVVLVYISGQIDRTEFSYNFAWKPYFELGAASELCLRNTPIPTEDYDGDLVWKVTDRSYAAKAVITRLTPERWWYKLPRVHHDGDAIARLLLERLDARARAADAKLVAVSLRGAFGDVRRIAALNQHVTRLGIPLLDLIPAISSLAHDPPPGVTLFQRRGHLSPHLNRRVAEALHEFLESI